MRTRQHELQARRIVLISGFAAFIIFGIRLSFAVFFAEFVSNEGWSNESAASIFSVSMLVFAFGSTPGGILLDKYGPRRVFSAGALILALGLFLSSRANSVFQLAITYGLVGGSGLAIVGLGPIAANVAAWVLPAQRGRAIGIAFAGTGLGSLIFVPLSTWLIEHLGWRNAYVVLGSICLFLLTPLLVLVLRTPPALSSQTQQRSLRGNWNLLSHDLKFWLLMLVALTAIGPLRALTVHQVAYIESVGFERQVAANYVGLAGFLTAGTFIGWGIISDRFGRGVAFTLGALCLSGSVAILLMIRDHQSTLLLASYAVLLALGEGSRSSQTTAIASDIFQNNGLGLVNGLVGAMFGLGAAFVPWIVGRLRDSTVSYLPGLATIVVVIAISIGGVLMLTVLHKRGMDGTEFR